MPDLSTAIVLTEELRFLLDLGLAIALSLAGGALAVRFGQPPIVGYLAAGIIIGPFTPGYVGNTEDIGNLAELGVVLLLFALGVEFSVGELSQLRPIAAPGAVAQVAVVGTVGGLAAVAVGLPLGAAFVVGATLAISSTIVVLKVLADRGEIDSLHGRVGIGWMIVQDLLTNLPGGGGFQRYEATIQVTLDVQDIVNRAGATGTDAWLVFRVRGDRSIFPLRTDDAVDDTTLPVLLGGDMTAIAGALRGHGIPAAAFTAPVFVDYDGGGYRAPFAP